MLTIIFSELHTGMQKKYKAKRGILFSLLTSPFVLFPIIVYLGKSAYFNSNPLSLLPAFLPSVLFTWLQLDTSYQIVNEHLIYRSAFLRGKIDIASITQIQKNKTLWVGIKPALATKGLIVSYNMYDEVYIAPISNTDLVNDLLAINPNIKVY